MGLGFSFGKSDNRTISIKNLMSDLNHLRTFLAVYRSGAVTSAAAQLAITQPAASGHIKTLEAHLKRQLFRRVGRRIEPTSAADALARAVAPYLDGLEDAMATAMMRQDSLVGTIRLGGPVEFMMEKVLPGFAGFSELGIRLEVKFGLTQDLVERLDAGELDLVIATMRVPRRSAGFQLLYREEFVLVGAPKWSAVVPPATISARGAEAISELPWLAYGSDFPIVRRYFREVFHARPPRKAAQVIPDLRAMKESCIAGLGITVLPKYLCASAVDQGMLVVLHSPSVAPGNDIFVAWNRIGLRQPLTTFVRDRILEAASGW
jgi:DNA-binding transcriptional LysR family regulator